MPISSRYQLLLAGAGVLSAAASVQTPNCRQRIEVGGEHGAGNMFVIPNGWKNEDGYAEVPVKNGTIVPQLGGRAYFADNCTAGNYNNTDYARPNLLGKIMTFSTDLRGAGCGCNAAFYLTSMGHNKKVSECFDHYCDANNVCGCSCAEIDIMEANQHAWHSTLHTKTDTDGAASGFGGGGDGWNGPRNWTAKEYGINGSCIDTAKPFDVAVSFPIDKHGILVAMQVTLSQKHHGCKLQARVDNYASGMKELTHALLDGMTPIVSYWSDDSMTWMDGLGADGKGPCKVDHADKCGKSVKFWGFKVEDLDKKEREDDKDLDQDSVGVASGVQTPSCHERIKVNGEHGVENVFIIPTGWKNKDGYAEVPVEKGAIVPQLGGRAYFADSCTAGKYNNTDYARPNLLGKIMTFSTDLRGAGCGCNAAFYLTSMGHNKKVSECFDHYCDANNVCGCSCAEIDIMEANQHAWHSTLHTKTDADGAASGFGGGGDGWNGPRNWTAKEYGVNGSCIDTAKPFDVAVSFPIDKHGILVAMQITLSQKHHSCKLQARVDNYASGMQELTHALLDGMTPIVSYWSDDSMTWMDGLGADGKGPCNVDHADKCGKSIKFWGFKVEDLDKKEQEVLAKDARDFDKKMEKQHPDSVSMDSNNKWSESGGSDGGNEWWHPEESSENKWRDADESSAGSNEWDDKDGKKAVAGSESWDGKASSGSDSWTSQGDWNNQGDWRGNTDLKQWDAETILAQKREEVGTLRGAAGSQGSGVGGLIGAGAVGGVIMLTTLVLVLKRSSVQEVFLVTGVGSSGASGIKCLGGSSASLHHLRASLSSSDLGSQEGTNGGPMLMMQQPASSLNLLSMGSPEQAA